MRQYASVWRREVNVFIGDTTFRLRARRSEGSRDTEQFQKDCESVSERECKDWGLEGLRRSLSASGLVSWSGCKLGHDAMR